VFHTISTAALECILFLLETTCYAKFGGMQAKERLSKLKEAAEAEVQKRETDLRSAKAKLSAYEDSVPAFDGNGEDGVAMSVLRRFQEKVKREQANVLEIEAALIDAKGRVAGFEEVLRMFPKEGEESELRAGSQMFDVRELLRSNGKPMTLTEILKAIGAEGDEKKRNSLRGSLASYANKGRVFTKEEAPETFGLIEFQTGSGGKN